MALFTRMLLTVSSSSSSSQPDPEESVEDVEAEPDLEFPFALFQDIHLIWIILADNLNYDLLFI